MARRGTDAHGWWLRARWVAVDDDHHSPSHTGADADGSPAEGGGGGAAEGKGEVEVMGGGGGVFVGGEGDAEVGGVGLAELDVGGGWRKGGEEERGEVEGEEGDFADEGIHFIEMDCCGLVSWMKIGGHGGWMRISPWLSQYKG